MTETEYKLNGAVPELAEPAPKRKKAKPKKDHLSKEKLGKLVYKALAQEDHMTIKQLQALPELSHISSYRISAVLADMGLEHKVQRLGTEGTGGQIVYALVEELMQPTEVESEPDLPLFEVKVYADRVEMSHGDMARLLSAFAS